MYLGKLKIVCAKCGADLGKTKDLTFKCPKCGFQPEYEGEQKKEATKQ